jgi:hypothetical protein
MSHPDKQRRKSHFANCEEKRSYPTRRIADAVLRRIRKNSTLNSYRCERCGRWHLGRMTRDVWDRLLREIGRACKYRGQETVG